MYTAKSINFWNTIRGLLLIIALSCTIDTQANTETKSDGSETIESRQEEKLRKQQEQRKQLEERHRKVEAHLKQLQAQKDELQKMKAIHTVEELQKFVEEYPHTTTLIISGAEHLTDASYIVKLKNLHKLELKNCPALKNIAPLGKVQTLKSLNLNGCRNITNIMPLTGLPNLEELDLSHTNIKILSPLGSLAHLKKLTIIGCNHLTKKEIKKLQLALPHLKIITHEEPPI